MRKKSMLMTLIICLLVSLCAVYGAGCNNEHTHTFDGITVEENPAKTVYTAFEEFDLEGIKVVKHCTGEECPGEEVESSEITFAYEKEGADKLTADMTKVIIKVADYETELKITVNKIAVQLPAIDDKEYNGENQTATVAASELFTVSENNGGADIGEYDVKLTLTDTVNYEFVGVDGAVATVKFKITKTDNEVTMPASIDAIKCGEIPVVNATAKENAVITYVYATEEDGEYGEMPETGFVAGTWFVKAVAAETKSYKKTESVAGSFTVEHAFSAWNTQGDETDVGLCVCGEELRDYVFDKTVSSSRKDISLTGSDAITLDGISEYNAIKSIKYGEMDLGTDISALVLPEEINDAAHGEQTITVVVTDAYDLDHTVLVPVTIITKSISTFAELQETVTVKVRDNGKYREGKYYILADNITIASDTKYEALPWDNAGHGFAGTLDGRGHSIIGGKMWSGGLFGGLESATVKNIKFDDLTIGGGGRTLLAGTIRNTLIENVEINVKDEIDVGDGGNFFGIIASHDIDNVTVKDVKINAPKAIIPRIIGKHPRNTLDKMPSCENVVVTVKYLDAIAENGSGKIGLNEVPGLVVKMSESVTLADQYAIDPTDLEFADVRCDLKNAYQSLDIKQVFKNGEELDKSFYEIKGAVGEKYFYIEDLLDIVTENDYNTTMSFKIVFDGGEGSDIQLTVNVKVLGNEKQVTLAARQDVVLKDADGEKTTATLDLGEYADCVVSGATFGNDETLTINGSTIDITDGLKNGTHGEQNFVVFASKNGVNYRITVPVTVVTEVINDWASLLYNCQYSGAVSSETTFGEGKYYILGQDINGGESASFTYNGTKYSSAWCSYGKGFAGTLDGREKTIKNVILNNSNGGLFSGLSGATIKKVNIEVAEFIDRNNNAVIACNIKDATLEDITITFNSAFTLTKACVIAGQQLDNSKLTNIEIHAEGSDINILLGTGQYADKPANICTDVTVYAKSLAKISNELTAKEGIDFVEKATKQ